MFLCPIIEGEKKGEDERMRVGSRPYKHRFKKPPIHGLYHEWGLLVADDRVQWDLEVVIVVDELFQAIH